MTEIAACPWCKETFTYPSTDQNNRGVWIYIVVCDDCGATGPHASTQEKAIERWNAGPKKDKADK